MIKLLLLIVIIIASFLIKLISVIVGSLSVLVNKRGTYINFATQYLKNAKISYARLVIYLPKLVDIVIKYSKEHHYQLADELDVLEASLYNCVIKISEDELKLLPYNGRALPIADGFIIAINFMNENNI